MTAPAVAPVAEPGRAVGCPYIGLRPFEARHAPFFFGRERDQRLIIANLLAQPLTVLYGASGVGKSSILNAGVVPQLARERPVTPVVVFSGWSRGDFRRELAERCIEAAWSCAPDQPKPSPDLPLDEILRACAQAVHDTVLVVFDQFEEYFSYHPKTAAPDSFEAEFARAVNRDEVDAGFLLALRDDGLAKLDHFQERIPNLLGNRLRLRHLDEAGARMAITGPLAVWNADPAQAGDWVEIEPDLVDRLIEEVRVGRVSVARQGGSGAAGKDREEEVRIEAPFLQLVLLRLWDRERQQQPSCLRAGTLRDLGGAEAIVGEHLDLAMRRLNDTEQAVCAAVFDRLVTPTGSKIACSRDALVGWAGSTLADHVDAVLDALCKARILRPTELTEERDQDAYEVFHDVLAPAILDWRNRYIAAREQQEALDREREALNRQAERERVEIARRAQRRLLIAATVLSLIALAGWGFSFLEGQRAEANAKAAQALLAVSRDEPIAALDLALEAADETGALLAPTRAAEDALRQSLRILPNRAQVLPAGDWVSTVAFSGDGRLVASGGRSRLVTLWEMDNGQLRQHGDPLPHDAWVRKVAFLPGRDGAVGNRLLTVAGGTVRLFDLARPDQETRTFVHGSPIYGGFAVSPDHRRIATAGWDGDGRPSAIKIWEVDTDATTPIAEIDLQGAWVMGLAFSPDGRCIATASVQAAAGRTHTEVWSIERRERVASPPNPTESDALSFTPGGDALIAIGRDGLGRVFRRPQGANGASGICTWAAAAPVVPGDHTAAGAPPPSAGASPPVAWETAVLTGHVDRLRDLALTADGNRIATASGDGTIRIWDAAGGQTLFVLRGHTHYVDAIAASPDGLYLVSGGRDDTLRVWDVGRHAGSVNDVAFAAGGSMVATGGADHTAKLWSVTGDVPKLLRTLYGHGQEIHQVALDPAGETLATAGFDGTLRLWRVSSGKMRAVLHDHRDQLRDVAFDASGRRLASAGADGMVYLYDLSVPEPEPIAMRHGSGRAVVQVQAVAISPRDDLLATAGNNGVVRLWSLEGEDRGQIERKGYSQFIDLDFHPSGRELAALGLRSVVVWPMGDSGQATGQTPLAIDLRKAGLSQGGSCTSLAYDSMGMQLAVACNDGAVYLFAMPGGQHRKTVTAHDGAVRAVAFSPDGRQLATASADQTFLVAPLPFADLYQRARRLQEAVAGRP